ncbi:MAG TPA: hypothetical protein VGA09_13335 [Candidatus Binatia bacterium]
MDIDVRCPHTARWSYWLAAQLEGKWLELSEKPGSPPITQRTHGWYDS